MVYAAVAVQQLATTINMTTASDVGNLRRTSQLSWSNRPYLNTGLSAHSVPLRCFVCEHVASLNSGRRIESAYIEFVCERMYAAYSSKDSNGQFAIIVAVVEHPIVGC